MSIDLLEQAGPLPDGLPLWRYMKLSSLFLLREGKAFFPSVATLRSADPLEGDLRPDPAWVSTALSGLHGQPAANELDEWLLSNTEEWVRKYQEANKSDGLVNTALFADMYQRALAKRRAVWCWFMSDIESAGMWSIYGQGGVAVGTTLGALRDALPTKVDFQVSRIRYADRSRTSMEQLNPEDPSDAVYLHRPHFVKGREYEHEHEVRIITRCHGQEKGRLIRRIQSEGLIKRIVLSPLWPQAESKAVGDVLKKQAREGSPLISTSELLGSIPDNDETHERIEEFFSEVGDGVCEADLPHLLEEL
jgi:hypothetical protein